MQHAIKSKYVDKEILSKNRAEEVLQSKGFYPHEKIITSSSCLYIKCLTTSGYIVFVELDKSGTVAKTGCDFTYIKSDISDLVSYDYRMGCFKTAGNHVAGVAFQCENGICTLTSINEQYPRVANFVTMESYNIQYRSGFVSNQNPQAYPIVRLGEILIDSKLVHSMIAESSDNMMRASYSLTHAKLLNVDKEIIGLNDSVKNFMTIRNEKMKDLCNSIKILEDVAENNSYCDSSNICEEDRIKDAKIMANLAERRKLFTNLIKACNNVAAIGSHFRKFCEEITEISKYVESEYENLDKVLKL